ncbi:hypothetical protein KY327_01600 [Candidatus Woesearchaeota archaeon]|nr:hypothetical protein [Candidatus Woesearchaeota archaeon]
MKIAGKDLGFYWKAIRIPLIILVAWHVASLLAGILWFDSVYQQVFANALVGNVVPLALFVVAGYLAVAEYHAENRQATWSGALTGLLGGAAAAIVGVLAIKFTPVLEWSVEQALAQAAASGQAVDREMVRGLTRIMMTIGMVLSPFISALIGALAGWVGGLVARQVEK